MLLAESLYDWLMFLHIVAAMVWLGGGESRLYRGVVGEPQRPPLDSQLALLRRPLGRRSEHL